MITLYTFGPAFGLPDPSPFVTKVEVLLKMAGLAYRTDTTGFRQAPKGKLPYIDDDGEQVADSTLIRWHLENKYRIDFDKGLSAEQRAIAWAFEKMAHGHAHGAGTHRAQRHKHAEHRTEDYSDRARVARSRRAVSAGQGVIADTAA
jgi:glutathione S-transferase